MPVTDAVLYVHGTGASAYGGVTNTAGVLGDSLCYAGSQYSNLELDFGTGYLGGTGAFPSNTEKGYSNPPTAVGDGGVEFGLHIVVGSTFNTLTSINFQVCTSATTAALYTVTPNPIAQRTLYLAQLAIGSGPTGYTGYGPHYFIPVNFASCLEFLRFYAALTGSDPTTGTILAWFGPKTGGEQ